MPTATKCLVCGDTGWKPVEDSAATRVTRCECWQSELSDRLIAGARIPRRYQHCELQSFITYDNTKLLKAVAFAKKFSEEFPVVAKGLFFVGPPGIGKTHLGVAVLREVVLNRGARGLFYDTRDLLRVIRSTYDPINRTTELEILKPVMEAELLVLDDLGAEKTSEWVEETLNLIVNTRYNEKRATIFTSNYEEKDDPTDPDSLLCRVGFRMHSRLYEMCEFLEFDGADYRHLPPNPGPADFVGFWKGRVDTAKRSLPSRAGSPARAQLRDGSADLKWSGGKAGTP